MSSANAPYSEPMFANRLGRVAVIFVTKRTHADDTGYAKASADMQALVETQPGYCGAVSARDVDGLGITVSYWEDEAAAAAWRNHPEHSVIREAGRASWYEHYALDVAQVTRSYDWTRT